MVRQKVCDDCGKVVREDEAPAVDKEDRIFDISHYGAGESYRGNVCWSCLEEYGLLEVLRHDVQE